MSTAQIPPETIEFGEALRRLRERHGWTRPVLAMRLQQVDPDGRWNAQKITAMEHGRQRHPRLRELRMLSIVLGCEISDLAWPTRTTAPRTSRTAWNADMPADLRLRLLPTGAKDILCRAA